MSLGIAEPPSPSEATGPIGLHVRRIIEERIVTNVFRPGERLSENDLAVLLGVSRQPIREALIRLTEAGLVRVMPQRATVVTRISVARVNSARFLRAAVEQAVVREAAAKADRHHVAQMRVLIREQSAAIRQGDHAAFLALDDDLHRAFAASIAHEDVWRRLQNVKLQMDRVRYLSLPDATPASRLIRQHTAIVDAIAARDPEAAAAMMQQHLEELLSSLPRLVARLPDYFDNTDGA
jgi:GntR family transcriptional regulator, rspAB operon transcriptional repressor